MQFCSETREYMCLVGTCEKWWKCLSLFLPLRKRASLSVEVFKCLNWEAWKGPSSASFEVLHSSLGCFGVGQLFGPRLALFFMWYTSTEEQQCRCVGLATADACVAFPVLLTDVEGANVSQLWWYTPLRIILMGEGVSHDNQSFHTYCFLTFMAVASQGSAIINMIFVDEDAQKFLG